MKRGKITEEDGVHKAWYDEARAVKTPDELASFARRMIEDYEHDHGTICHAIAATALAGAYAIEHSPTGGITGFQGGAVMWEFIRSWQREDGPMRLMKYENLLYPQYDHVFNCISKETWEWAQERARKLIAERGEDTVHPNVLAHWKSLAAGRVPFGLQIEA